MFLVYLATISSAFALISGIAAVGSGHDWHFTTKDILEGKQNAVLYVWVTFSSIFSLAHLASMIIYGVEWNWSYALPESGRWMVIHSSIGFMLVTAHLFIKRTLAAEQGVPVYVWGPKRLRSLTL